ncbi:hypothetical protein Tco_0045758 [Tanacetum coccineum]
MVVDFGLVLALLYKSFALSLLGCASCVSVQCFPRERVIGALGCGERVRVSCEWYLGGEHAEFDESDTYVLERFNTSAGNHVKEILLKLNLPDHRSILTDSKMEVKFLMGLDDVYQPIRSNILTKEPLPLVKTTFVVVSGEESHQNVTSMNNASKTPSATAFDVKE